MAFGRLLVLAVLSCHVAAVVGTVADVNEVPAGKNATASSSTPKTTVTEIATTTHTEEETTTITTTTTTTTTADVTESTASQSAAACSDVKNVRQQLRCRLLRGYDRYAHPVRNGSDPVVVSLGLSVIYYDLEEVHSTFAVDVWMRILWNDPALVWEPQEYHNLSTVHFGDHELWRPDILLYNNAGDSRVDPYGKTLFVVESNGDVLWVPAAKLRAYCDLDLLMWPFDIQTCYLHFGSWTSSGDHIDLKLYKNLTKVDFHDMYAQHREWKVNDHIVYIKNINYPCCPETYPEVVFRFTMKRESPAYKSTFILPCLMTMLMSLSSFVLPPGAGEKICLNGFAFLTVCLYLVYFAKSLPFHSKATPLIVLFFGNSAALIGVALMLNVICLSLVHERKHAAPPTFLKKMFSTALGKALCLGHYYHQVSFTHQRLSVQLMDMAESDQQQPSNGRPGDGAHRDNMDEENDLHLGEDGGTSACSSAVTAATSAPASPTGVMAEWILVAKGLERIFMAVYVVAFAVVCSVYV